MLDTKTYGAIIEVLRSWQSNDDEDYFARLVADYTLRSLTARELQALALLDPSDVFKLTVRWFGTTLAPVARAHLVTALKNDPHLV